MTDPMSGNKPGEGPLDPGFMELASRFLDGVASEEELESLDAMVGKDPHARRTLAELLNQHGTLAWTQRSRASWKEGAPSFPAQQQETGRPATSRRGWWVAIPLAACLLLTFAIIRYAPSGNQISPGPLPSGTPALTAEPRVVGFQDGISPSKDYQGTRDVRLVDRDPAENRGSEPFLEVDKEGEHEGRPALLKWDLRLIPPGSRLISVSLEITVTDVSREREVVATAVSRRWEEMQATWLEYAAGRRWEAPGGKGSQDRDSRVLARFKPTRGTLSIPFNETGLAAVQRWVNSPDTNRGFLLEMADRGEFTFDSRESSTAAHRPRLTVTYTPNLDRSGH